MEDSDIFQYRLVYPEGSKEPKLCLETMHERDPNSTLKYTRGELLRGTEAEASLDKGHVPNHRGDLWNGLPLARTSHVYLCFRGDLFKGLLAVHQDNLELRDLLCETARMEQFGPIHVCSFSLDAYITDIAPELIRTRGELSSGQLSSICVRRFVTLKSVAGLPSTRVL